MSNITIITHLVKGGNTEFESWLYRVIPKAEKFQGDQGIIMLKPTNAINQYISTMRLNEIKNRESWELSPFRAEWVLNLFPLVSGSHFHKYLRIYHVSFFLLTLLIFSKQTLFAQDTTKQVRVAAGGEYRVRYEKYWNDNWGGAPKDHNGYLLHRFLVYTTINFKDELQFYAELKSALHSNLDIPPRPVDEDKLDFQELYLKYFIYRIDTDKYAYIKAGRQSLIIGSGRLIDAREYTNALLSFDGIKFTMANQKWQLNTFVFRQSRMAPGVFDNSSDPDRSLWGLYYTRYIDQTKTVGIDIYYLGQERNRISYTFGDYHSFLNEGLYNETRHTLGLRIYNHIGNFDCDIEPIYQTGSYSQNNQTISAWRIAATVGYTVNQIKMRPRVYLNIDISSGDRDSTDRTLSTFHSPYPDILDPSSANMTGFKMGINAAFSKKLTVNILEWFIWRTSAQDGIYGFLGFPYRPPGKSNVKYVGNSPAINASYWVNKHFNIVASYATEFVEGGFLSKEPPGIDLTYAGLSVTYKY